MPPRKRITRARPEYLKESQGSYQSRNNRRTGRTKEFYAEKAEEAKKLARTTTKTIQQIADDLDLNVGFVSEKIKGIKRKKVVRGKQTPTTHDVQRQKAKEVRRILRNNEKFRKTNPRKVVSIAGIKRILNRRFGTDFDKKTIQTIEAHRKNGKRYIPAPKGERADETPKQRNARIKAERVAAQKAVKAGTASSAQKRIVRVYEARNVRGAAASRERFASRTSGSSKTGMDWDAISKLTPQEIEEMAKDKGGDNYYRARQESKVYETLPDGTQRQVGDRWVTSGSAEDAKIKNRYVQAWRNYLAAGGKKPLQSVDHIGPGGDPRVIDGKRLGGGVKTRGGTPWFVGFTNLLNTRLLDPTKNIRKHNVFTEADAARMERAQMKWLKARNLGLAGFGALLVSSFLPSGSKVAEAAQTALKYAEPILDPAMFLLRPEGQSTDVEDTADFRYMKGHDNIMDREYDVSRLGDPNWGGTLRRLY